MTGKNNAAIATNTLAWGEWSFLPIEKVAEVNPRHDRSTIPDDMLVSFVPMSAIGAGDGTIHVEGRRLAGEVKKGFTFFIEGDVLFAKITPCMENGKMAVVPKLVNGYGFGSTEFHILRPRPGTDAKYLYYYISSQKFRSEAERHMTGAVGQRRVSTSDLKEFIIPLPSLDQQKYIATQIEKQFSRLDEAVVNLRRVKDNLRRYRAAVLKAAVEGRLVEREAEIARREGRDYETGAQLLQRVLETRRRRWTGKTKYKEPAVPDASNPPPSLEGWVWATADQLLMSLRNGLSKKPEDSKPGIPILRISAVRPLELDTEDRRFYRPQESESTDHCKLKAHDILFVRYNGTKEFVGACALVSSAPGVLLYPDKLIRGRVVSKSLVMPSYVAIAANVGKSREHIDELIKTTAGQQGIAGGNVRQMPLPLPPYAEQQRIVTEVDRQLSFIREIQDQIETNLRRANRLRSSILGRTFSRAMSAARAVKGDKANA